MEHVTLLQKKGVLLFIYYFGTWVLETETNLLIECLITKTDNVIVNYFLTYKLEDAAFI